MKNLTKFFFATILLLSAVSGAFAYDFEAVCESGQTLYYEITSSTAPYTVRILSPNYTSYWYRANYDGYERPTGNLTIPSSVRYNGRTYSVTSILDYTFAECSELTSVIIPNSVTLIGCGVFLECSGLTSVTIPNTVTIIYSSLFYGCSSLTSVTIPNSVTSIGGSAFYNCSGLTSITIPSSVTSIDHDAFQGCSGLTSITIPSSVTSIGARAFQGCSGLTSITIPNSVTRIEVETFRECSGLTSIEIPSSVTNIESAFQGCSSIEEMTIPFVGRSATETGASASTLFGYIFGTYSYTDGQRVIQYYSSSSNTAYYIPSSLRSVTVNGGKLNYGAFYGCSMLTSVTIPNSVTSIGDYAFKNCSGLTSLTIPNAVTSIGEGAFSYCSGLTSVTIGDSVTSIGGGAFYGCSGLTSVTMGRGVTSIGESAFHDCNGLTSVYYTGNSNQWCEITFGNDRANPLRYAHNLYINNNLVTFLYIGTATEIKPYAFYGATCLNFVVFPSTASVTSIGNSAFTNCTGLTSVTINNSVTSIGTGVFSGCSGLEEMTIPFVGSSATATEASPSTLFGYLFGTSSYTGGTEIYQYYGEIDNGSYPYARYFIPDGLRSVTVTEGNLLYGAFYGCSMLTSITIGNGVTSIGESAFYNCTGLTGTLTIPYSVTSIGSKAFYGCSGLASVKNFQSVTSIGSDAFYGCSELSSVYYSGDIAQWCGITFGNPKSNPLYYAHNLYWYNSLVTNLAITYPVTEIKPYAFYGATCLTSVTISRWTTNIGESAFGGCSGLVDMTIPFVGSSADATEASASTLFGYLFGTTSYTGSTIVWQYYRDESPSVSYEEGYYIPNGLRSVTVTGGNLLWGAFYGCSMLTSVTIGNSVTSIGVVAFKDCLGLTSIDIPNSVTIIKANAFNNCSGLTSVTIGNSVTIIENYAFYGCSSIQDIYSNPTTPPAAEYSLLNRSATLWVPCGYATTYRAANFWRNFSDIRERLLYTLNVSSADLTMGTASITQQPTCTNETAIISATPNRGYAFSQWNDNNTDNPRTITLTSNVEYIAMFEALTAYSITAVSADEEMGTVTGGGDYYEDETVTLTATANDGYWFVAWTDGNTDNPRTVTVTGDATYTATFIAFHTITVTSADETLGTASGSGDYAEGLEIEISATPAEHYHFAQWNDGNTDNPRTITVTEDETFTASFAIDRFTITVESNDEAMGIVSESGTYDYGTEIQISATPVEGYGFLAWNDGNTDNPRTIIVTEDITYTATFGTLRTITVLSADETMGTVSGSGIYVEGAQVEISTEAVEHYHFTQWNDGSTDNPRTITVAGDSTFTASFAIDQHTITVESADEAMGTVSGSNTYDYGTEIQISATASEHYHFVSWNDGNTDNPRTITVTGDATYTASFAIDQHTITVESADETMGTVSEGGTYDYGTEIQISASARDGYQFVSWNDGNTDNPRTITVVADAEYVAYFTSLTGIDESAVSEIALFPNPATDVLNITTSETISEIEIVNVMGQVVKRIEVNSDTALCDVEDLKAGVYMVRISTLRQAQGAALRKFIKE